MAEAEDVIVDAARHATIYARALWRRWQAPAATAAALVLVDVAPRLDLLVTALCGRSLRLRIAQSPAPPSLLALLARRRHGPLHRCALPATDGEDIWLPPSLGLADDGATWQRYRVLALQQAMRVLRGSAMHAGVDDALARDLYLLLEADAADHDLVRTLPGVTPALQSVRDGALAARPAIDALPAALRPVEALLRQTLGRRLPAAADASAASSTPAAVLHRACSLAATLRDAAPGRDLGPHPLLRDVWTGELHAPPVRRSADMAGGNADPGSSPDPPRSARLPRRPDVRKAGEDEDDEHSGAWMVQTAQPHEQAEDPHGLQRPSDRDEDTAADEYADALSELPEARLLTRPGQPKEILLSDDAPTPTAHVPLPASASSADHALSYPEWDWRRDAYHPRGATVHCLPAVNGTQAWVDATLHEHRGMLQDIRRRFELLRARRVRTHRQLDGDDIDLEAWIEAQADYRAGLPLAQRLYQDQRRIQRDMAIMLLVDVSGSTDSWVVGNRRIVDVEREALLLVCIALEGLGQPYAVQAFSGETAHGVVLRAVKHFDEPYGPAVALRIAGLEPENYTRAGAAVRHASTLLMRQAAAHRLLLMLSDGKPNDVDQYEGRYGVEDLRQAVTEAKLQGISPFCLTIDRQAANYLPRVFGAHQYALLPKPELLPTVLLDWLRRLLGH